MAKFKKARRIASRAYGKFKRYSKSNKTSPLETVLYSGVYAVSRPTIANMIPDIQQLGGYSDNIVLGGIGALASWKGKGMVKKAGLIILANEAFIAAAKASSGMVQNGSNTGSYVITGY